MNQNFLVIDASVIIALLLNDETGDVLRVLDDFDSHSIIVPPVWIYEVSNALLIAEQRKRSTPAQTEYWTDIIDGFDYKVDTDMTAITCKDAVSFSRLNHLSPYDMSYLDLAIRSNAKLATLDSDLIRAAKDVGVTVLK